MEQSLTKQNNIFKLIITLLTILIVFTLSGCGSGLDYSDFRKDHLDTWEDVLDQGEAQYLVYYYGPQCSHCITIKDEVLTFAQSNEANVKMFFISSSEVFDSAEFPLQDPVSGKNITGTPTMLVVKNGVLVDMNVGASFIESLLEQINEGSYGFIE